MDPLKGSISVRKEALGSTQLITRDYYKKEDSIVTIAESKNIIGRGTFGLSNTRFGGSSNVKLEGNYLLDHVMLHLVLPKCPAYVSGSRLRLTDYWGYNAIKQIRVTYGSSNTTLYYSGETLKMVLWAQFEESQKERELLDYGGLPVTQVASTGAYNEWVNYDQHAYVFLNLSTNSVQTSNAECHKPIPLDIISSGIDINIDFYDAKFFIDNVETAVPSYNAPNGFLKAELITRIAEFTDKSFSLKSDILGDPTKIYRMPYSQARTGPQSNFKAKRRSATDLKSAERTNILLTSLENSDLLTIMFYVVRVSDVEKHTNVPLNPGRLTKIEDVTLTYGGDTILDLPSDSWRFFSQLTSNKVGSHGIPSSFYFGTDAGVTGTAPERTTNMQYCVTLDLSRTNAMQCMEYIDNTPSYYSTALNLGFNIIQDYENDDVEHEFRCYMTYVYPANLGFQAGATVSQLL